MDKNEIVKARFAEFGIPFAKNDFLLERGSKDWDNAKELFKGQNFVIVGDEYLKYCLKMAKLFISRSLSTDLLWVNQSSLDNRLKYSTADITFLIGVHKPVTEYKSEWAGQFINRALSKGKQAVIGASSIVDFEEAFPYELDQLEELFEIWSV